MTTQVTSALPDRTRTPLERMLRRDRKIINGPDPTKWNWPEPATEEQLAEARAFIVENGVHGMNSYILVLDGDAELHGQQGGDAWFYGQSQQHGQQGGYARFYGQSQQHGQQGGYARFDGAGHAEFHNQLGGCVLDKNNVIHGDASLMVPLEVEVARLDQIREAVMAKPNRLVMSGWHGGGWSPYKDPACEHDCGTTHCLAGFAQAFSDDEAIRRLPAEFAGEKLLPRSARLFFATEEVVMKYLVDREYAQGT